MSDFDFDFSINIDEMATEVPILENGYYASILSSFSVEDKEGNSTIKVSEVMEAESKGSKKMVGSGRYELRGSISYSVTLFSEKAKKVLGMDNPRRFGRISIKFDQKTGKLDNNKNTALTKLFKLFEVNPNDIYAAIDRSIVAEAKVPDELAHVENIELLHKAGVFYSQFFKLLGRMVVDTKVMAEIKRQKSFQDDNVLEDRLNNGTPFNPSIGMTPYEEGKEFDLPETA